MTRAALLGFVSILALRLSGPLLQPPPSEAELLAGAERRIEKHRKADAIVRVVDRDGEPLSGVKVRAEQIRHAFLFGCNAFPLLGHRDPRLAQLYQKQFSDLFNYATLGFYWGAYEREPGKTNEELVRAQARWCRARGIAVKGHPLVWHEVYPAWGPKDAEAARESQRKRIAEIVGGFVGLIDRWDVVNEATVTERFDNGIGMWAKRDGAAKMVGESLEWARAANPKAILLYNDYNIGPAFEKLAGELLKEKRPLDALGIQSHMHRGEWPLAKAWEACESYARFGKPLHFTELTVLSGEHGWEKPRPWPTTTAGEARQAEYVEKLFTLLFSHPAVEAITWWDFMDGAWQGAPAGLVRADLSPKPAYTRLHSLVKDKWRTRIDAETDASGEVRFRGFQGDYHIQVFAGSVRKEGRLQIRPKGRNRTVLRL